MKTPMTYSEPNRFSPLEYLLQDPATQRWLKEVDQFLPIKSHFVLSGNIRDRHAFARGEGEYDMCTTQELLIDYLALNGFKHFFAINPLQGITIVVPSDKDAKKAAEETVQWLEKTTQAATMGIRFEPDARKRVWRAPASFSLSVEFMEMLVHNRDAHCAILFNYLMGQIEQGQTKETDPFVRSLIATYEVKPYDIKPSGQQQSTSFYNTVFWICDRDNDLPAWLTLNNPRIRSISLSKPDGKTRTLVAQAMLTNSAEYRALSLETQKQVAEDFSKQTDGLLINDLEAILQFIPTQKLPITEVSEAAHRYKLGVTEDPWRKIEKETIRDAERMIRARVKGQEPAITKTLDIIRRAKMGLAGAQGSRSSGKPKGVMFFAGPTGVGKTELAKSITEALFGDETAYIRFDMSEFNHEHSDQRLIGAPPGYVGFEAGGELTVAIRQKPFSVVLFDEIEKAHPRILDKFLQILDDGQLTSGKGERVYFSDAILVFTSNLGVERATPEDDYETLRTKLTEGVSAYFKDKLNRPELLNRIGDNIVIFDFIRPSVAIDILGKMIQNTLMRLKETQNFTLTLSGFPAEGDPDPNTAFGFLVDRCASDLRNGGRGIGNKLESYLINPLGRAMWDVNLQPGSSAHIKRIRVEEATPVIELEVQ